MKIPALLIPADITRPMTIVQLSHDAPFTELASTIGCNIIEAVQPSASIRNMIEGASMLWVDEEGLLCENPKPNLRAFLMSERRIVGNALLTGVDNAEGMVTGFQFVLPACTVLDIIEQNAQGLHRIYAAIDAVA